MGSRENSWSALLAQIETYSAISYRLQIETFADQGTGIFHVVQTQHLDPLESPLVVKTKFPV